MGKKKGENYMNKGEKCLKNASCGAIHSGPQVSNISTRDQEEDEEEEEDEDEIEEIVEEDDDLPLSNRGRRGRGGRAKKKKAGLSFKMHLL